MMEELQTVWFEIANWRARCKCVVTLLSALAFLSVVTPLKGAEGTAGTREQVRELILQLDAKTLAERSRAERGLLELGPAALKSLPPPELIDSIPVRESVRRIRLQLERRAAEESSGPSRLFLHGTLTLKNALQQMQKQTGNRISLDAAATDKGDEELSVNWDQTPFWECLDDLCDRSQLQWQLEKDSASIRVSRSKTTNSSVPAPVQRSGPFRLEAGRIEIRSTPGDDGQRMLRFNGRLSIEPRLRPLFLTVSATDLKAASEAGVPFEPWSPGARYEHPVGDGSHEVPVVWDFRLPESTDIDRFSIRGRIRCQIAASTERIVFDQASLEKGAMRRRGGVTVRLRNVAFDIDDSDRLKAEIGVAISYDGPGPAFESHRTWMFHNAAYLESGSGGRVDFNDFETTQQSDGVVSVEYRWRALAAPSRQYQFVYEAPTLIVDVPLEINLDKLTVTD